MNSRTEQKKRVFTVLAIDGGGSRGIVPARILEELEELTGKPIAELFDLIGATSTGMIVASGLVTPDPTSPGKPKYTAREMKELFYRFTAKIFPVLRFKSLRQLSSGALYDPKPLEEVLEAKLGNARVKDSLTSLMIPATDITHFRPVWIKHIKGEKDASPEGWSTMKLKDAVRATTAAPTYFPAKHFETTPNEETPHIKQRHALIDGGFFGGMTMHRLLTQARKMAPPDAEIVVVHIGTGHAKNSLTPEQYNKLGPLGLISKAKGSILLSLAVDMTLLDASNDVREEIGDRFFSFTGSIDPKDKDAPSTSLDDGSDENLRRLEKFAEGIIAENRDEFARLCDVLQRRRIGQETHNDSMDALQKLTEKLEGAKTVKTLARIYRKVVIFASGLDEEKPDAADAELKALTSRLTEKHKNDLDRLYNVLQDKLENQNKILNSLREKGDGLTKITRKIFVDPFKHDPPPPDAGNDNKDPKPPAASADKPGRKFRP